MDSSCSSSPANINAYSISFDVSIQIYSNIAYNIGELVGKAANSSFTLILDKVVNISAIAERLALVLQTAGKLREAEELLERCLGARKKLLPDEHIQGRIEVAFCCAEIEIVEKNAANMLYTARVKMQISNQLMRRESSRAMAELDMAKDLLHKCVRVARHVLAQVVEQKGNKGPTGIPRKTGNDAHSAALILNAVGKEGKDMLVSLGVLTNGDILQSLNALGSLEIMKLEFPGARRNGQEQGL
ncbi:hypothetical protein Sango_0128800 [Sesamum angolense]|uniref:Uncharacterized protein n=1 Tax=Sesamum angolense TaxID=2727404 RepID=A0AAE1XF07_9LAMI|nr:hypothetical protein Sango_0128800 [Sesamum angolense]